MSEILPLRTSPREETLQFLRHFARTYQPAGNDRDLTTDEVLPFSPTAEC